mgnify:CR=1 FL=1|jgi:hypothetical protein
MEDKNYIGRPLKFQSVEELQQKIDAYFKKMDEEKRPYIITGLALALDTTRRTLLDYEEKSEFSHTIKKAKLRCENFSEESLFTSRNVTGAIFNLKNNYGWVDKQEIINAYGINEKDGVPEDVLEEEFRELDEEQKNKNKERY